MERFLRDGKMEHMFKGSGESGLGGSVISKKCVEDVKERYNEYMGDKFARWAGKAG